MFKAKDQEGNPVYINDVVEGQMYFCPTCGEALVIKNKGLIKEHHFAHHGCNPSKGYHGCSDHWGYEMTEWHKSWQERFDLLCREVVLTNGKEKHRADVAVGKIVVEFQHSEMSFSEFLRRNAFYTSAGYKVIWVFDATEEWANKAIVRDSKNRFGYRWSFARNPLRGINAEIVDAAVFLQLNAEKGKEQLVNVVKSYNDFSTFFTGSLSLSAKAFTEMVVSQNQELFDKSLPFKVNGAKVHGSSIYDLWDESYSGMVVRNTANNWIMVINGRDGEMYTDDWDNIVGKYCRFDGFKYVSTTDYKKVWEPEKSIWVLLRSYKDKGYEERKEKERKRKELIDSYPFALPNCNYLDDYLQAPFHDEVIFLENAFTGDVFAFEFVDRLGGQNRYNAEKVDAKTGEIVPGCVNYIAFTVPIRKVWRFAHFERSDETENK